MKDSLRTIASEIDFSPGQIAYSEAIPELKEDLMQVAYPDGQILDVGWYPESNPVGKFKVLVISNGEWDTPSLDLSTQDEKQLRGLLTRAARFIRQKY